MNFDTSALPHVMILLAAVAFVEGVYFFVSDMLGGADKQVNRRLRDIARHGEEAKEPLRRKAITEDASAWLATILESAAVRAFENMISTSGIRMSADKIMLSIVLVVTVIFESVRVVLHLDLLLSGAISLILGAILPLWSIARLRRRRFGKIASQLPDALDMLCRSMRAGHPVASGIKMVSEEMPDPIGTEFGLVYDEMSYGMDLRQSLEKMTRRLRIFEINYMVTSMRLQAGTGGNLAEILGSLANVIRERKKLHDKVKALSAEARLSGKILGALPFGVVTILVIINPHYYDGAKTNPLLLFILIGAVALCFMGIVLLRRVVNAIRV